MWDRPSKVPAAADMTYLTDKQIQTALDLLEVGKKMPESERWELPFPMGVFGTLRQQRGNNYLMHRGKVSGYAMAFMPHFIAHGLSISYKEASSAPFEVFFYESEDWKKMIDNVDALESFSPKSAAHRSHWGYYRTLAFLSVLPKDNDNEMFKGDGVLASTRDCKIGTDDWGKYPRIPCWVYSSRDQNIRASANLTSPVIWGAEQRKEEK